MKKQKKKKRREASMCKNCIYGKYESPYTRNCSIDNNETSFWMICNFYKAEKVLNEVKS